MMKHDLDYMIAVMNAAKEGKEIEFSKDSNIWTFTSHPKWDWNNLDYRIRPFQSKPEYVPYESAEEFLQAQREHGMYLFVTRGYYVIPCEIRNSGVWLSGDENEFTYNELLKYKVVWQDGTPCGKLK